MRMLVLNVMPQIERIPHEFVKAWGTAFERVCSRFKREIDKPEQVESELMRSMKWYMGIHQLLLSKRPKSAMRGHKGESYLRDRFNMFSERRYGDLIAAWRTDRSAHLRERIQRISRRHECANSPGSEADADRRLHKCLQLINEHHISRGIRLLEGHGVIEASKVKQQMIDKHPSAATSSRWPVSLPAGTQPTTVDVAEWVGKLDPKSGTGTDGRRPQYLSCLAKYSFQDAEDGSGFERAIDTFNGLWESILSDRLPDWAYHYLTYGKLCTLVKKPPESPSDLPDARPVNGGFLDRRIVEKTLVKQAGPELRARLEPQQLGLGTKYGCESLLWGMRLTLEQALSGLLLHSRVDSKTVFSSTTRARLFVPQISLVSNALQKLTQFGCRTTEIGLELIEISTND